MSGDLDRVTADRVLVDAVVRSRDRAAFGALYDRHTPYLYRLCLRLCGGDEDRAQDVVHDAWLRAVERFGSFEGRSELRTWLAGFVVNGVRAARRAEARLQPVDEVASAGLDALALGDDPALVASADRVDLERGIAALPPSARHVFVLHDVEGWTHAEIGRELGIEPGTSKSQLSRARALLRRRFAPTEEGRA